MVSLAPGRGPSGLGEFEESFDGGDGFMNRSRVSDEGNGFIYSRKQSIEVG